MGSDWPAGRQLRWRWEMRREERERAERYKQTKGINYTKLEAALIGT
jgi:hypothetical protein